MVSQVLRPLDVMPPTGDGRPVTPSRALLTRCCGLSVSPAHSARRRHMCLWGAGGGAPGRRRQPPGRARSAYEGDPTELHVPPTREDTARGHVCDPGSGSRRLLSGARGAPRAPPGVRPRGSAPGPGERGTALALLSGHLPGAAQHPLPLPPQEPSRAGLVPLAGPPGALPGDRRAVEKPRRSP